MRAAGPVQQTVDAFGMFGEPDKSAIKRPDVLRACIISLYEAGVNPSGAEYDRRESLL